MNFVFDFVSKCYRLTLAAATLFLVLQTSACKQKNPSIVPPSNKAGEEESLNEDEGPKKTGSQGVENNPEEAHKHQTSGPSTKHFLAHFVKVDPSTCAASAPFPKKSPHLSGDFHFLCRYNRTGLPDLNDEMKEQFVGAPENWDCSQVSLSISNPQPQNDSRYDGDRCSIYMAPQVNGDVWISLSTVEKKFFASPDDRRSFAHQQFQFAMDQFQKGAMKGHLRVLLPKTRSEKDEPDVEPVENIIGFVDGPSRAGEITALKDQEKEDIERAKFWVRNYVEVKATLNPKACMDMDAPKDRMSPSIPSQGRYTCMYYRSLPYVDGDTFFYYMDKNLEIDYSHKVKFQFAREAIEEDDKSVRERCVMYLSLPGQGEVSVGPPQVYDSEEEQASFADECFKQANEAFRKGPERGEMKYYVPQIWVEREQ